MQTGRNHKRFSSRTTGVGSEQKKLTVGLKEGRKRVEEPPVAVDLLRVLFLETKHDLARHDGSLALGAKVVRVLRREGEGRRVFEEVGLDGQVARSGRFHEA